MVSGGANRYYTLLKGDLEVVAAKGNLSIPRRNSATGCSFMSYPGRLEYPLSNQENHLSIWVDIFNFEMDNKVHKEKLQSSLVDMLTNIDSLSILPKNKLLLYQRYLLSKLSWHLTVANLAKTWVTENLDSITIRFIRQWLDLPISATLSGIILPCNQFGLNLQLPSVKFIQCQTVLMLLKCSTILKER